MADDSTSGRAKPAAPLDAASFLPQPGERALFVGQTGSGKSNLMVWSLLRHPDTPTIIHDMKIEPKYEDLPNHAIVDSLEGIESYLDDPTVDYIIHRPAARTLSDPGQLDDMLMHHLENWPEVGAVIDELYYFHNNGRAGPGLTGMYTRGRSRGITVYGGTQRPAWVSRFSMSEVQKSFIFYLEDDDDWKRIPKVAKLPRPPEFSFYFLRARHPAVLMKPVPLVGQGDHGYIDREPDPEPEPDPATRPPHVWL